MPPQAPLLLYGRRIFSQPLAVLLPVAGSPCCSTGVWILGLVVIALGWVACARRAPARGAVVSMAVQNIFLQLAAGFVQAQLG